MQNWNRFIDDITKLNNNDHEQYYKEISTFTTPNIIQFNRNFTQQVNSTTRYLKLLIVLLQMHPVRIWSMSWNFHNLEKWSCLQLKPVKLGMPTMLQPMIKHLQTISLSLLQHLKRWTVAGTRAGGKLSICTQTLVEKRWIVKVAVKLIKRVYICTEATYRWDDAFRALSKQFAVHKCLTSKFINGECHNQ